MKVIYYCWLIAAAIISLYVLIAYTPNYSENEFPLFTDLFLTIVYIPCLFLLMAAIPTQLMMTFNQIPAKRIRWGLLLHMVACFVVIIFIPVSLWITCMFIFIGLVTSAIYMSVTSLLMLPLGLLFKKEV